MTRSPVVWKWNGSNMHKMALLTMIQRAKSWTCLLVCLAFLAGCGGGGDGSSKADTTGGLSFQLQFIDPSNAAHLRLADADVNICETYAIDTIRATLSRIDGTLLASDTWTCEEHGGILDGVAPTSNLVLLVEGSAGGEWIWRGQKAGIEILPGQITPAGTVQMINTVDDHTPPQIVSTTPQDGADEVPINTAILVQFDEPVSAVSLHDAFLLTDDNSNSISGAVSYEDNDDDQFWQAKFMPSENLNANTQYTMTLLNVVRDLAGNAIEAHTWSFNTGSTALKPLVWGKGKWGDAWQ